MRTLDQAKLEKAKRIYVIEMQTAKHTAKKLGVTEKTLRSWINRFGWKQERLNFFNQKFNSNLEIIKTDDLRLFIEQNSRLLAASLAPLLNNYLKSKINQQINLEP